MVIGVVDSHSRDAAPFFLRRAFLKGAVAAQRAERHIPDRFIGACKENVKDRQHAIEVLLLQIDFHVFGDEVSGSEGGLHCVLQIAERAGEVRDAQRIRWWPHRLLSAKHIYGCFRKKLVDIKKIGTAEHIKRNRNRLCRFWKISLLPRVQFSEFAQIEFGELFLKKCGMLLPCRIARERRERRILRRRHPSKEARDIIRSCNYRQCTRRNLRIFLCENA